MSETPTPRFAAQGQRVRQYREALGATQVAVAACAGIKPSYWCKIEKGFVPLSKYANRVSVAFGLHLDLSDFDALWDGTVEPETLHRRVTRRPEHRRRNRATSSRVA